MRGTNNPVVCAVLDTCGLTGALSFRSVAHDASAEVVAFGSARRPYRDFLTALGLSRSGRAHGIMVSLQAVSSGSVRTSVSQPGGTCTDTAATGGVSFSSGSPVGCFRRGALRHVADPVPGPIFGLGASCVARLRSPGALGRPNSPSGCERRVLRGRRIRRIASGRGLDVLRRGRITSQVTSDRPAPDRTRPYLPLAAHEDRDHHRLHLRRRRRDEDRSGAALAQLAEAAGAEIIARDVVADDRKAIEKLLRKHAKDGAALIFTTGGTGFTHGRRDARRPRAR